MSGTDATAESTFAAPSQPFIFKVLAGFAALAVLSAGISLAGRLVGDSIAMGGHTDDPKPYEIVIGNNVLFIPGNEIRFERARLNGLAPRIDLYVAWPSMFGYSQAERDRFNNAGDTPSLIFLGIEERMMSRDMSGRLEPIYSQIIGQEAEDGPGGLSIHRFIERSGYTDEVLVVGPDVNGERFVARCLTGEAGAQSLAPCERDIHIGRELMLTYRFPGQLLADWAKLEAAVRKKADEYLKMSAQ